MSASRKITQFFNRPDFSVANRDPPSETQKESVAPRGTQSSPLTEPPSSSLSNNASSPQTPDAAGPQLKASLLRSFNEELESQASQDPQQSLQHEQSATPNPLSSFSSAQRVVRNGKEVVISSDGEDTDSIASLEAPETLFMQFKKPDIAKEADEAEKNDSASGMSLPSRSSKSRGPPRAYKNTLESLVVEAVDDNETEARIAKFKASLQDEKARNSAGPNPGQKSQLNEGILTSAFGNEDDEGGLQRLLDAVRRTEAFDLEKAWFFFDYGRNIAPPLDFPRDCLYPDTYMSVLREPDSRERAFYSGIVDVALAKGKLPDELITWIFSTRPFTRPWQWQHTDTPTVVPSEPRDSLRHAYCRAFKVCPLDTFRTHMLILLLEHQHRQYQVSNTSKQYRLSVRASRGKSQSIGCCFAIDTREHILNLLFRLALDISLTSNVAICSEIERAITAILDSVSRENDTAADIKRRLCTTAYDAIKDPVFQSRIIRHILPTSTWIAGLRVSLALAFLTTSWRPSQPC
ncbi:hypothetical protein BJX96DRAFT_167337 [Aspergillus floccosus]